MVVTNGGNLRRGENRKDYLPRGARGPVPVKRGERRNKKRKTANHGIGAGAERPSQYPEQALGAYPKLEVCPIRPRVYRKGSPGRPLGFRMIGPAEQPK